MCSIMQEEELMICKKWNQTPHDQPPPQIGQHTRTRGDTQHHPRSERCGQHGSGAHLEPWTPLEMLVNCAMCSELAQSCTAAVWLTACWRRQCVMCVLRWQIPVTLWPTPSSFWSSNSLLLHHVASRPSHVS